ncbi:MAG: PepSY-associated TM helix domain-containing protein [Myxococcota bacterium]|nr:PepSY-associated TM helix domain-containing protein [Myxococcota bacterium]
MADDVRRRQGGRGRWRAWLRALHRDAGYSAVGLTVVYAASGLAVNHVADWDPNFRNTSATHEVGSALPDDDAVASKRVLSALGITEAPREVYREGDQLEILFEHRTLHVVVATGHVIEEGQRARFFLRAANWLHLNRGKKAWTYFADAYAVALLFLASSGMVMLPGRKGLFGRGAFFVILGAVVPLAYVAFYASLAKG